MKTGDGKLSPSNLNGTNKKCEGRKRIKELFNVFVEKMALATGDFCLIGNCEMTYKKYIDNFVKIAVIKAEENEQVLTTEDIENLVATLEGEDTRFDFNKVIPMPAELAGNASPVKAFGGASNLVPVIWLSKPGNFL